MGAQPCFAPSIGALSRACARRASHRAPGYTMCTSAPTPTFTRRARDAWPPHELRQLPEHLRPLANETLDLVLRKKVFITQARKGYRANVDADCLAYFAWDAMLRAGGRPPSVVVDLGAGSGFVSLLLGLRAGRDSSLMLNLVEFQEVLANRAQRNLALNGLGGRVLLHDLSSPLPCLEGSADLVVSNPPFYLPNTRAPPRSEEKRLAHTETTAGLFEFTRAARNALSPDPNARFCMVHDLRQLDRIRAACDAAELHLLSVVEILQTEDRTTERVLVETRVRCSADEGQREHHSTLCLHPDGCGEKLYFAEMELFFAAMPEPVYPIGRLDYVKSTLFQD